MPWCPEDLAVAFTLHEAGAAGVSRHRLNRAQRDGRLWRPARGMYVDRHALRELPWPARHRALSRVAPLAVEHTVVSHVSAAVLLGLPHPRFAPGPISLTSANAVKTNRASAWVHVHRATLPAGHRADVDGIPVTTVARTVLDCLRTLPRADALAIADNAVRSGLTHPEELLAHLVFQRRWPGTAGSRHGLQLVDPRRENWFESASAAAFDRAGIEQPTPQVEVYGTDGTFLGRVDFLWEKRGVIGEADGRGKLLGDFDDDRSPEAVARRVIALGERSMRLREVGFEVFHWSPAELHGVVPPVARRFHAASGRARPERIRATLVCGCCHVELQDCAWRSRTVLPQPATLYSWGAREGRAR